MNPKKKKKTICLSSLEHPDRADTMRELLFSVFFFFSFFLFFLSFFSLAARTKSKDHSSRGFPCRLRISPRQKWTAF